MKTMFLSLSIRKINFILFAIFIILIAFIGISGNFPLNDDWRYAALVKSLLETGKFEIKQSFAPTMVLQVLWGYLFCLPFGFSFVALRLSTLVSGFIAILLFTRFVYFISQNKQTTLITGILLLVNPFFFNLNFSFMSEIPFIAVGLLSLWYFYQFSGSNSNIHLVLGILFSLLAFLIRQPGITFPVLYGCLMLLVYKFRVNQVRFIQLLALLGIPLLFYLLFTFLKPYIGLSDAYVDLISELKKSFQSQYTVSIFVFLAHHILMTLFLCGFLMVPVLFLIPALRLKKIHTILLITVNIIILIVLVKANRIFPYYNYIYNFGLGPALIPDIHIFDIKNGMYIPDWWFVVFTFIGQLSATYLILVLIKYYKQKFSFFAGFILLVLFVYIEITSITSFFDRYTLFPFIVLLILISPAINLSQVKPYKKVLSVVTFLLIAYYAVAGTHDYLSWQRTKYSLFQKCQNDGITIEQMDAGHEINSWYLRKKGFKSTSDIEYRPLVDDKYMITFGMVKGYKVYAMQSYFNYLHFKKRNLYILVRTD